MTACNQKNCHCAVFSAFWLSIAAAAPLEFFVSPSGSDSNPGTEERPFATLEKASAAVRERAVDRKAIVTARGGRYVLSKTWTLDDADSGTVSFPVIYRAFPGETVELTGFQDISLSTLKPVDSPEILNRLVDSRARAHLMELDLSEVDMTAFGRISRKGYRLNRSSWPYNNDPDHVMGEPPEVQLFIDGKRQILARWPNTNEQVNPDWKVYPTVQLPGVVGYQEVLDRGPYEADEDFFDRGGKIRVDYDRVKYWTQAEDIWVEGCLTASWRLTRNKIKTIDPDRQTIEFAYGEVGEVGRDLRLDSRVNNKALVWSGPFFWYINLLEEIDVPGEYYIDYANKKLYFYPPEDMSLSHSRLSFPKLNGALVRLQNASHIVFDGLTVSGSLGSGIVINGSDSVRIRNCEISDVSGRAVDLGNSQNRNCVVEYCHIHGIGSEGVFLGGGDAIQMIRGNNVVSDCEIHDIGFSKLCWSSAVSFSVGSVGNTLQHSRIYDLPHMGIQFRGNDNTIQYCEVYDFGKIFLDNGAVYGNYGGRMYEAGLKVYHNWFHSVPRDIPCIATIYPDQHTPNWTVELNLFTAAEPNNMGSVCAQKFKGPNIQVRHNLYVNQQEVASIALEPNIHDSSDPKIIADWMQYYQLGRLDDPESPLSLAYPYVRNWFDYDHLKQWPGSEFSENLIFNPTVTLINDGISYKGEGDLTPERKVALVDLRDNVYAGRSQSPFTDWKRGDFSLKKNSRLIQQIPAFENFDFHAIGQRP